MGHVGWHIEADLTSQRKAVELVANPVHAKARGWMGLFCGFAACV
jgi:hypothetical protein